MSPTPAGDQKKKMQGSCGSADPAPSHAGTPTPDAPHSPLPWRVSLTNSLAVGIFAADSPIAIAEMMRAACDPSANAALIVHRVNVHDQLVAALRTLTAIMCDKPLCGHFTAEEMRAVIERALAAVEAKP